MSNWLQKRLAIWLAFSLLGGALLWNTGMLHAQNDWQSYEGSKHANAVRGGLGLRTPRIKMARDQATRSFVELLQLINIKGGRSYGDLYVAPPKARYTRPTVAQASSFSRKSEREIDASLARFLVKMAIQWKQPQSNVKVQRDTGKTATVTVEAAPKSQPRPLILIQEGNSWGVDVVETYAKWNGFDDLESSAKAKVIYKLTGVILDALPRTEEINRTGCRSNLRQLALGFMQYKQDYDEKFPIAKSWGDALSLYAAGDALFNCPSLPKDHKFGYAFNSKLSSKVETSVGDISKIVAVYETSILKRNAFGMGENPAFRHAGGANYLFADGRVKWFPKTHAPNFNLQPR